MFGKISKKTSNSIEEKTRNLELCIIDDDHITISLERFTELVAAEVKLGITADIYNSIPSYNRGNLGDALAFLERPTEQDSDS